MGMMKVMETLDGHHEDDSDPEPSWDEAVAAFGTGTPVEVVRPSRKIVIFYRYISDRFHATSPDLLGFEVTGSSLYETKMLARADLARYLDPSIELDEREPRQVPSEGASHSRVVHGGNLVTVTVSSGRSRTFVSPTRLKV